MGTPPNELPPPPATQVVGQQTAPSTLVPVVPAGALVAVTGRHTNSMAVISLVTALVAPFGHVIAVGGFTLIVISLVTGHMARAEIRKTGEDGANLALIGLIISYVHLAISAIVFIFFFGVVVAILAVIFHAVFTSH